MSANAGKIMSSCEIICNVCRRPGMYVGYATFDNVCAYISGYDTARDGGPLAGLREWLIQRVNCGTDLGWARLAQMHLGIDDNLLPHSENSRAQGALLPRHVQDQAIAQLGQLLEEFFAYREKYRLETIFYEYGEWLQSSYNMPLSKNARPRRRRAAP